MNKGIRSITGPIKSFPHLAIILLFLPSFVKAQEKILFASDTTIGINEYVVIKATAPFSSNLKISDFPEIQDFSRKRTVYSREDSLIVIRQYYSPRKHGIFTSPRLFLILNGDTVEHKPVTVTVTGPKKNIKEPDFPPAEAPFTESIPDAFVRFDIEKDKVFNRQTINASLHLYIPENEKADLNFIDLKQQIIRISEKLRPAGALASIQPVPEGNPSKIIKLKGISYRRYVIIKGSWLPYSAGKIEFPSLELTMLTYKESKNKGFTDRKDKVFTLRTAAQTVEVKALPDHPLKNQVNAGNFRMNSWLSTKHPETGKSFHLSIELKGNVPPDFLLEPTLKEGSLKFYRFKEKSGTFRYQVVAEKAGSYSLSNHIYWVYFNTRTESYDTLQPVLDIHVQGAHVADGMLRAKEYDPFYNKIQTSSNRLRSIYQDDRIKFFGNVFILAMLAFAGWLLLWKNKAKG